MSTSWNSGSKNRRSWHLAFRKSIIISTKCWRVSLIVRFFLFIRLWLMPAVQSSFTWFCRLRVNAAVGGESMGLPSGFNAWRNLGIIFFQTTSRIRWPGMLGDSYPSFIFASCIPETDILGFFFILDWDFFFALGAAEPWEPSSKFGSDRSGRWRDQTWP